MKLKDAVTVVTGSSQGLGLALVQALKEQGAQPIASSRPSDELEKVGITLQVDTIPADVNSLSDMKQLADQVMRLYGRIDIWINNAGIWMPPASVTEMDFMRVQELMTTNIMGLFHGMQVAGQIMVAQRSGTLINILSSAALSPRPMTSAYCASKYAGRAITHSVRREFLEYGINVFAVYPGKMDTNLFGATTRPEGKYMTKESVASAIVENLLQSEPAQDFLITNEEYVYEPEEEQFQLKHKIIHS